MEPENTSQTSSISLHPFRGNELLKKQECGAEKRKKLIFSHDYVFSR